MTYAEVAVNSPFAQRQSFSYAVPSHLNIRVGQAVFVPFGQKILQGIVIEITESPSFQETAEIRIKEVDDILDPSPLLSPVRVSLARWISEFYLSPLFDAVALMLPPGFERKALTFVSLAESYAQHDLSSLSPEARELIDLLREKGQVNQKELEKHFGKTKAPELVSGLVKRGILARSYQLEPVRMKPKTVQYLQLSITIDQAQEIIAISQEKLTPKQVSILEYLAECSQPVSWTEVRKTTRAERDALEALMSKGLVVKNPQTEATKTKSKETLILQLGVESSRVKRLVTISKYKMTANRARLLEILINHPQPVAWTEIKGFGFEKTVVDGLIAKGMAAYLQIEVKREPVAYQKIAPTSPLNLTPDQQSAFNAVKEALGKNQPGVFLLQGVTASGKTEIYLQALAETVRRGKKGIVLVPEIALTPQTIERFAARFPGKVAVLHSRLTPGEQFDEWRRIR